MADPLAVVMPSSTNVIRTRTAPSVASSTGLVLGFWWAATGLTFGMQWSESARIAELVVTSVLALAGGYLVASARDDSTVRGARRAFLGASLLWWWSSSVFYAGFGIYLPATVGAPQGSLTLAVQAIVSTLGADLVGVATMIAIVLAVRQRVNTLAAWTFATYWGTLQMAKLNVFFGVQHSGAEYLPARLARLSAFFGPPRNSALLPVSLALLTALCVVLLSRARREEGSMRHGSIILATLIGLALVEHAFLGIPAALPLWDMFLRHGT